MIYLDNNATSWIDPSVVSRMHEVSSLRLGNPSSQHQSGRSARHFVEEARERILEHVGASNRGMASDQLIFTSGGTEANNLAILGLAESRPGWIVVSRIEHPSVLAACERLQGLGRNVLYLPVDRNGVVLLDELEQRLSKENAEPIALVSIMAANNETGVLQPISRAAKLCNERGILFHTDAVQLIGKGPVGFANSGCDAMTITAHKIHGPIGIGALILKSGVRISPQIFGGHQQLDQRPGTESPVLTDAFAFTLDIATERVEGIQRMQILREKMEAAILASIPGSHINGMMASRLPHTTSLSVEGIDRQALQVALDLKGVACSTGSACASGSSEPSHVLMAMGIGDERVRSGIRLSLSRETTDSDIQQATDLLVKVVESLRK